MRWAITLTAVCGWLATAACAPGLIPSHQSEEAQNAALRQALRRDPAFALIPASVRASMVEVVPHGSGFGGQQTGGNGWAGSERWDGTSDPNATVAGWDLKMRQAGWVPVGGVCAPSGDPIYGVQVTGYWRKTIQGTCASFYYGVVGSRVKYALEIRPVGDPTRGCSASTLGVAPGPVGCGSTP